MKSQSWFAILGTLVLLLLTGSFLVRTGGAESNEDGSLLSEQSALIEDGPFDSKLSEEVFFSMIQESLAENKAELLDVELSSISILSECNPPTTISFTFKDNKTIYESGDLFSASLISDRMVSDQNVTCYFAIEYNGDFHFMDGMGVFFKNSAVGFPFTFPFGGKLIGEAALGTVNSEVTLDFHSVLIKDGECFSKLTSDRIRLQPEIPTPTPPPVNTPTPTPIPTSLPTVVVCPLLQDTYIQEAFPDEVGNREIDIVVGTGRSLLRIRALLKFNLSGIPSNALVQDARLRLWRRQGNGSYVMKPYRLLENWVSSDTWNILRDIHWDPDWCNYISNPNSGGEVVGMAFSGCAREWIEQGQTNHGIILMGDPSSVEANTLFYSSRYGDPSKHPRFEVTYTLPLN